MWPCAFRPSVVRKAAIPRAMPDYHAAVAAPTGSAGVGFCFSSLPESVDEGLRAFGKETKIVLHGEDGLVDIGVPNRHIDPVPIEFFLIE